MVRLLTKSNISRLIAKRNITKNKKISIALVITLSLIFSIFILLIGINHIYTEVFINEAKSKHPNVDIIMTYDEYTPTKFINKRNITSEYEDVLHALAFFNLQVLTEINDQVHYGYLNASLPHEFEILVDSDIELNGYEAVVSSSYAQAFNINIGDTINFTILDNHFEYVVAQIIADSGSFETRHFFIDKTILFDDLYELGYLTNFGNVIYISTSNIDAVYQRLRSDELYSTYKIDLVVDQHKIELLVHEFTSLIVVAGMIILFALMIVVNSLFQIILKDVYLEINVFETLGDQHKLGKQVLIYQWIYYIGISLTLGIFIAQAIIRLSTYIYGIKEMIWISLPSVLVTVSIVSVFIFVRHIMIFRTYKNQSTIDKIKRFTFVSRKLPILMVTLFIILGIVYIFKPFKLQYQALFIISISLVLTLYALNLSLRVVSSFFAKKESVFSLIHTKALLGNKFIHESIRVLFISFIVITILLTVRIFTAKEIKSLDEQFYLDIMIVNLYDYHEDILDDIRTMDIKEADAAIVYRDVEVYLEAERTVIRNLTSVDRSVYTQYFGYPLEEVEQRYETHMYPYIQLPKTYELVYHIEKGDMIQITLSPEFKKIDFVVAGFIDSNYDHFAYTNLYEKLDSLNMRINSIFVNSNHANVTMQQLISLYSSHMYYVVDAKEILSQQLNIAKNVLSLFTVITIFVILSFLFVIYNHTVLKFESQKNDYAKTLVLGIDKSKLRVNHFKEWLLISSITAVIGSVEILILSKYLKYVLLFFDYYKDFSTNIIIFGIALIIIIIILMISYIINYKLIRRMNVINEIKTY